MSGATTAGEPASVRLSLLGPLAGWRGETPVGLGGLRQRAVLARLGLASGAIVATERLVDELWQGDPPPSAVNTLQSYVSNLRRAFAPGPSIIERAGPGYRLAIPTAAIDARHFEHLVNLALEIRPTDPGSATRHLEEALGLWRGPALVDFGDEEWARADAVRLEELRLTAMEARFDALLDTGRHAGVVGELDRAVGEHPLRERFCAQLIVALYRSGRQAEALRAYERTRAHLADELGLDPTPELNRLATAVLEHEPWLAGPGRDRAGTAAPSGAAVGGGAAQGGGAVEAEPAGAVATAAPPTAPGSDAPVVVPLPPAVASERSRTEFVGRADELEGLERRWAASVAGARAVVVLAGEPGVGKTRLAMELARRVHAQGGYVLWGRCTSENVVAYQPALEALRVALAALPPDVVRSLLEPRPALAALTPGLSAAAAPIPDKPSTERLELYETLAELVEFVTRGNPALLVVDDLQWADSASLSLFSHLVCHDREGRLLIVATTRRPAGRPTPDLDRFIAELRREQRLDVVELDGVGVDEVAALLAHRGVRAAQEVAPAVHARTGGNPFFVEELAGHGGDLAVDQGRLPDSVRDMLDLRIGGLDPAAGRVLLAAAVIGHRSDLDLLGAVCDLGIAELLDVTDPAVDAGLLVEDDEPGSVAFPHALVRQAILARSTRNREAQLHLRVAEALEHQPHRFDRVTAIAHHLVAAGRLCPPIRAAGAAVAAASAALEVLAPAEAMTWARRALELLRGLEGDEARLVRIDALLAEGMAQRHLGDRDQARACALTAAAEARRSDQPRLLARCAEAAMLATAGVGFDFGQVDTELVDLLAEALARQAPDDALARADLLAWSAIALAGRPDRDRQEAFSVAAMALAEEVGDAAVSSLVLLARRLVVSDPSGLDERLALGPRNLALAQEAGTTVFEVAARVFRVVDLLEADQVDEARAELEALRQRIAPFGRPAFDAYVHFLDASMALLAGDLAAADAASAAGMAAGERAHGGNAVQAWAAQQYLMAWDRGQLASFVPLVQDMVERYPAMPIWRVALAATQVAAGDDDGARATYRPLVERGLAIPEDSLWGPAVGMLAEVCWLLGDQQASALLVEALAARADRLAVTGMGAVCVGHLCRQYGLALAAAGHWDDALVQLERAVERSRACGFGTWLARSLVDRAEVLERRGRDGDRAVARRSRDEADALARRLGVTIGLRPAP